MALVCVEVGVWRRSWAPLLRTCEALSRGVSLVALGGLSAVVKTSAVARRAMSHRRAGRPDGRVRPSCRTMSMAARMGGFMCGATW